MSGFSRFLDGAQGLLREAQAANPKLSAWRHSTGVLMGLPGPNPEPAADEVILRVEAATQPGHVQIWATDKKGGNIDVCVPADDAGLAEVRKAIELTQNL